jgi:cytidine diphosphoramidate kinase
MVIWLIGMSGSGKTTLANEILITLRCTGQQWLFIDGDRFRSIMDEDLGHTIEDRRKAGQRMVNFSLECAQQNLNLLVCILSIFPEHQELNRKQISEYREVFIDVPLKVLIKRDNKNIYQQALDGRLTNVVGVDIPFVPPPQADVVVSNVQDTPNLRSLAEHVLRELEVLNVPYRYSVTDRLVKREKYEYIPILGSQFLEAYVSSREQIIDLLKTNVYYLYQIYGNESLPEEGWGQIFENLLGPLQEWINRELPLPYRDNLYEVSPIKNILLSWLTQTLNNSISGELWERILLLLKRFEVSKRLYKEYLWPEIKKASEEFDEILPYAIFSILLQRMMNQTDSIHIKAILMNTLLKVGDILASCPQRMATPCEQWLSLEALSGELKMYSSFKEISES